jgi:hypothetical protein
MILWLHRLKLREDERNGDMEIAIRIKMFYFFWLFRME